MRIINAKNLRVIMKYLFCEINKRNGGTLIAMPDEKMLKIIVSIIAVSYTHLRAHETS